MNDADRKYRLDHMLARLKNVKRDDVDEYGILCLTTILGFHEAKGWLAMKGITL
jgi:hypothetical protein